MKKLTYDQKVELQTYFKISRDPSERDRIRAVLGFDEGISVEELAKVLRLSQSAIRKYISDYDDKQKICNDSRGGSDFRLTIEESQLLNKHLIDNTYLKVKDICSYVKEIFHKEFSRSGMTAWLKQHHFVFKRPKLVPGKLNPEQQKQFIKEYEDLKQNLKPKEVILFGDATHPQYQSRTVCGWIKQGEDKTLQTTGKQERMHFLGAINLDKMQILTQEYKSIDSDAMIDFCKKIEQQFKAQTIYLILDNARAGKNKKLDEYLKSSHIKIKYLPPYSPNLNPIERVWKILKEEKINNCYYNSASEFYKSIRNFILKLSNEIINFASRINDNFQKVELNPIKISAG